LSDVLPASPYRYPDEESDRDAGYKDNFTGKAGLLEFDSIMKIKRKETDAGAEMVYEEPQRKQ
jgi:hypothetical protein